MCGRGCHEDWKSGKSKVHIRDLLDHAVVAKLKTPRPPYLRLPGLRMPTTLILARTNGFWLHFLTYPLRFPSPRRPFYHSQLRYDGGLLWFNALEMVVGWRLRSTAGLVQTTLHSTSLHFANYNFSSTLTFLPKIDLPSTYILSNPSEPE